MKEKPAVELTEVTASFGGTVNLGNYENFKIDLSVTYRVNAQAYALEDIAREAFAEVRGLVRDEVAKLESRNVRGWLRDTDLKAEKPADSPTLPEDDS